MQPFLRGRLHRFRVLRLFSAVDLGRRRVVVGRIVADHTAVVGRTAGYPFAGFLGTAEIRGFSISSILKLRFSGIISVSPSFHHPSSFLIAPAQRRDVQNNIDSE